MQQPKSFNDDSYYINRLSEVVSPNRLYKLSISESGIDRENALTQVFLSLKHGGTSVYIVNGVDVGIRTFWKDDRIIVIETRKGIEVKSQCTQLQILGEIFQVEIIGY